VENAGGGGIQLVEGLNFRVLARNSPVFFFPRMFSRTGFLGHEYYRSFQDHGLNRLFSGVLAEGLRMAVLSRFRDRAADLENFVYELCGCETVSLKLFEHAI
jgi:hypothetical protein